MPNPQIPMITGTNFEAQMKRIDTNSFETYSLTKDLEYLKQAYPRYPIPTDTAKVQVKIEPLFTEDLGTLELVGDELIFTPGNDLTTNNPARFNIAYIFDTSTDNQSGLPDDLLSTEYHKTTGYTTAEFSLI